MKSYLLLDLGNWISLTMSYKIDLVYLLILNGKRFKNQPPHHSHCHFLKIEIPGEPRGISVRIRDMAHTAWQYSYTYLHRRWSVWTIAYLGEIATGEKFTLVKNCVSWRLWSESYFILFIHVHKLKLML